MLAVAVATVATAQNTKSTPPADAILISQIRSGNTVVSRYKIPHNNGRQAEFDMHYAINRSNISPNFSDNSRQIAELKDFMMQAKDTTMHISAIHIVGYASPDGSQKMNDTLAAARASSLYHYAVNTYHPKQNIDVEHKTFKWSDCVAVVEKSDIPQKSEVLAILKSTSHSEAQKEMALRKLPEAWRYMTAKILPQMRYADIEFDYGVDEFVTRTATVEPSEPAKPVQTSQPQQQEVIVDEEMGIIIATPKDDEKSRNRKDRKAEKRGGEAVYEVVYW